MCAVVMIVMNEICEQPFQMALSPPCDPGGLVGSFQPNAPPLRFAKDSRTKFARVGWPSTEPHTLRPRCTSSPDQRSGTWDSIDTEMLPQLLDDPRTRRMPGDIEMQDAPPIVADDEEPVEHAERDVGTAKKSIAAIASRWLRRNASQRLTGSGFLGARFIQREIVLSETSKPSVERAMNAWCSPGLVLGNHPEDQLPHFLRRRPSPGPRPGFGD